MILYGGEKVFAAGADIKEMQAMDHTAMVVRSRALQDSFTAVARIPKPVVAAVTGYALGGGCELALCADFRIAADNAKLGQPEILLGLIPGAGGTQRLSRLIGPSKAKDLIFTGRMVKADEALTLGLVDRVVPAAEVYEQAHAWAAKLAQGPALALRAAKESVDAGLETDIDTGLTVERNWFAGLFATEDRERGHAQLRRGGPGQGEVPLSPPSASPDARLTRGSSLVGRIMPGLKATLRHRCRDPLGGDPARAARHRRSDEAVGEPRSAPGICRTATCGMGCSGGRIPSERPRRARPCGHDGGMAGLEGVEQPRQRGSATAARWTPAVEDEQALKALELFGNPTEGEVRCRPGRSPRPPPAGSPSVVVLRQWGLSPQIAEDAVLLVSELVGNAVRHTGARVFGLADACAAGAGSGSRCATPRAACPV